ncbi:MAG: RNA polymerase sigma factor [Actinomycetota bacterium]
MSTGDAAVAARIAGGDRTALEDLYRELGGAVQSVAFRVLRDRSLAEDIVQETFLTLWRAPHRYQPERGSLRTFLQAIAHRRAVDVVRSEVARARREQRPPEPDPTDVEEEVWVRSLSETVRAALDRLGEDERRAITLAYYGGYSYAELARRLGEPEGTVKSRIRSGMRKLSSALAEVAP